MEFDKRWTVVTDCDLDHGALTNGRVINCAALPGDLGDNRLPLV